MRYRHAAREHLGEAVATRSLLGMALARTDQLDIVIAFAQAIDKACQRYGDPIDLRRIGFGDDGKAQRSPVADKLLNENGVHKPVT